MMPADPAEMIAAQQRLLELVKEFARLPLEDLECALGRAETLSPLLDPTGWRDGKGDEYGRLRAILDPALRLKQAFLAENRKAVDAVMAKMGTPASAEEARARRVLARVLSGQEPEDDDAEANP